MRVDPRQPSIIERAYQLARTAQPLDQIRRTLALEGYTQVDAHLQGPKIRADLKRLMAEAQA